MGDGLRGDLGPGHSDPTDAGNAGGVASNIPLHRLERALQVKFCILAGSLVAGLAGYLILRWSHRSSAVPTLAGLWAALVSPRLASVLPRALKNCLVRVNRYRPPAHLIVVGNRDHGDGRRRKQNIG